MTISAKTLRILMEAGLEGETLLSAVESMEEDMAERKPRSAGAERQARYRQRKAKASHCDVTGDVTCDASHSDASVPSSPHTPHQPPPSLSPKKTPKGVQKGPLADWPDIEDRFKALFHRLPPQARRKGEEVCRFAYRRAVASGADPGEIAAAADPWMQESGSVIERFDRWLDEGLWRQWLPKAATGLPPPETHDQWRRRVRQFHDHAAWHAPGPPPDDPACQAPPEILAEFGYRERAA